MFTIRSIGSSSSGNSYILYTQDPGSLPEVLLLECGMPWKKMLEGMDFRLTDVIGCLVSHEHNDHFGSIKDVISAGIDVYASPGTFSAIGMKDNHRMKLIKDCVQFQVGGFTVLPFSVEHDAKEPLGFLIQHEAFGKLLFATDTYYIRYKFNALNYIMVECNYSQEIIGKNLRTGVIDKAQISRLLKSHFSLERVKQFLKENDLSNVRRIYLLHLSDRNSHAEDFKIEIEKLTGIPTEVF